MSDIIIAWSPGCHIFLCFCLGVYVYGALGREQVKESATSCGGTDADETSTDTVSRAWQSWYTVWLLHKLVDR